MSNAKVASPYGAEGKQAGKKTEVTRNEQLNRYQRKMNGIQAFKILGVTDEGIVIPLPKAFGENRTTGFPLSDTALSACEVGKYADFTLSYTTYDGKAHSYMVKFWGITPPEFIPTNGEDIGR